jgi:hypothetical protein
MIFCDASADIQANIFSGAISNAFGVALVDQTGARITTLPITGQIVLANSQFGVTQTTSPWLVAFNNSLTVYQGNSVWAVQIASGAFTQPVTGTLGVTQATSPWTVLIGSNGVTQPVTGTLAVTQATSPWITHPASPGLTIPVTGTVGVTGIVTVGAHSVGAVQQGSWQVEARVTQVTSPWVTVIASNNYTIPVTGTMAVTQTTSPWIVQVASIQGAGISPTSVWAIQQGSWQVEARITQVTSPLIVQVASIQGAGISPTSVWAIQQGSWQVNIGNTVLPTQAASTGWTSPITGTMAVTQTTSPWIVQVASIQGAGLAPTSVWAIQQGSWRVQADIQGSVPVTQGGSFTVTIPSLAVGQSGAWSALAIQQGSWQVNIGNTVLPTQAASTGWTSPVTGTLAVTQATSPWVFVQGSTGWTTPVTGTVAITGVVTVGPSSVAAVQQGSWQIDARVTQVSSPWVTIIASNNYTVPVTGTLAVTQATSPWVFQQGSTGWTTPVTGTVAIAGTVTVAPSSVGAVQQGSWNIQATQSGSWTVTVPSLAVGQAGSWGVIQSGSWQVLVTQATSPWVTQLASGTYTVPVTGTVGITGTVTVAPSSVGAVQQGSWQIAVSQVTSPWVTVIASNNYTVPVTGTLAVTQTTSPWIVQVASIMGTGLPVTQGGSWTVIVFSLGVGQVGVWSVNAVQQGSWSVSVTNIVSVSPSSVSAVQQGSWNVAISQAGSYLTVREFAPLFTLAKLAWEVTSAVPFPYDGSGIARSSAAGTINFATDVMSSDVTGLIAMIVSSGPNLGAYRPITWNNQSSREANVTPNWPGGAVTSGTKYVILLDCRDAKAVQFRSEVNSYTGKIHGAIGFYSGVQSGNIGNVAAYPANVPIPSFDGARVIDGIANSFGTTVPSFWPAENVNAECRGYVGAKFFVTSYTSKFSMWGAAC